MKEKPNKDKLVFHVVGYGGLNALIKVNTQDKPYTFQIVSADNGRVITLGTERDTEMHRWIDTLRNREDNPVSFNSVPAFDPFLPPYLVCSH